MTTTAASTIHSHSSDEPDPPAAAGEAAAGFAGAWPVAGASAVGAGGAMPALRLGIAVRLGVRLEIAVLMAPPTGPLPPHPAARDPTTRATAATASPFLSRFIPVLRSWRSCCVQRPVQAAMGMDPAACLQPARRRVLTRPGRAGSARLARQRPKGQERRDACAPPAKALQPISPVSSRPAAALWLSGHHLFSTRGQDKQTPATS